MKGRWNNVNFAIRAALEGVTLADMMNVQTNYTTIEMSQELHERL